eukprot:scaffold22716_cov82-Cylindrotheca_fusiformis.AAC.5
MIRETELLIFLIVLFFLGISEQYVYPTKAFYQAIWISCFGEKEELKLDMASRNRDVGKSTEENKREGLKKGDTLVIPQTVSSFTCTTRHVTPFWQRVVSKDGSDTIIACH